MRILSGYSFARSGKYVSIKVRLQGVRLSYMYQLVRLRWSMGDTRHVDVIIGQGTP